MTIRLIFNKSLTSYMIESVATKNIRDFQILWTKTLTGANFCGFLAIIVSGLVYSIVTMFMPGSSLNLQILVLGGIFQGLIIGSFQAKLLKKIFPKLNTTNWLFLTTLGTFLVWFFLINKRFFPQPIATSANLYLNLPRPTNSQNPQALLGYYLIVAIFAGFFLGYIFSFLQWLELTRIAKKVQYWLFFNILGWGFGLLTIVAGFMLIPITSLLLLIVVPALDFLIASFIIAFTSSFSFFYLKHH